MFKVVIQYCAISYVQYLSSMFSMFVCSPPARKLHLDNTGWQLLLSTGLYSITHGKSSSEENNKANLAIVRASAAAAAAAASVLLITQMTSDIQDYYDAAALQSPRGSVIYFNNNGNGILSNNDVRFCRTGNHWRSERNFSVRVQRQSCILQVKSLHRVQNNTITHAANEVISV